MALLVGAPLFDRFLEMLDRVETDGGREPDDVEGDTADDEPSLGSGHFPMDQTQWALPGLEDLEDEHDGSEPSLGSLEAPAWSAVTRRDEAGRALGFRMVEGSQEQWGLSGRSDLEDENEHHDEAEHTADAGPAFEMDLSRAVARD